MGCVRSSDKGRQTHRKREGKERLLSEVAYSRSQDRKTKREREKER